MSAQELTVYEAIKQDIRSLNSRKRELQGDLSKYHYECQELESELERLLANLLISLQQKREEINLAFEERVKRGELVNRKEEQCINQQLQLAQKLQQSLEDGKQAAAWLSSSLDTWVQMSGERAMKWRVFYIPIWKTLYKLSPQEYDDYYYTLKNLLIRISHCLTIGRPNVLDVSTIPLVLDWRIYKFALCCIKREARKESKNSSVLLSKASVTQIEAYIDYLIQRLHRYPQA